jgi:thioredoxin-related protein
MKRFSVFVLGLAISSVIFAQAAPESADAILKQASEQAARENKNVFVIFHASWCGWCHKMDTAMNDAAVKAFFDDNYVVRHLTVHESKGKENLENPGALALLQKYNGDDQGIPFWLIFDKNGKLLADSQIAPGENSGCPASEPEVNYFISVLKKTSPLTDAQLSLVHERFRKNEQ